MDGEERGRTKGKYELNNHIKYAQGAVFGMFVVSGFLSCMHSRCQWKLLKVGMLDKRVLSLNDAMDVYMLSFFAMGGELH